MKIGKTNANLSIYSATRLKVMADCKKYFWHRYVANDLKQTDVGPYAQMGSAIHAALEKWRKTPSNNVDSIVAEYNKHMHIDDKEFEHLYKEGEDIIRNIDLSKLVVGELVDVEYDFTEVVNGFTIVGIIDKVELVDDKTLIITDYKSNQNINVEDYIPQLAVYDLVMESKYPELERVCSLLYLRHNKEFQFTFEKEHRNSILKSLNTMKVAVNQHHNNEDFWVKKPKRDSACHWCSLSEQCWDK